MVHVPKVFPHHNIKPIIQRPQGFLHNIPNMDRAPLLVTHTGNKLEKASQGTRTNYIFYSRGGEQLIPS